MRTIDISSKPARSSRAYALLTFALVVAGQVACNSDAPSVAGPSAAVANGAARANASDANAIVVTNVSELVSALVPQNASRRIVVRAGNYDLTQVLEVPDGATLEGDGQMLFDASKRPTGFTAGTRTTLRMTSNVGGDILTLGNGASVRGIAIEDLAGRLGNAIAVDSREAGDSLSAKIFDVEITNPNPHAIIQSGPVGCGLTVLTRNPNLGAPPAAHAGAVISATMTRSLIHSLASGTNCGVFAFNFAPLASVSVSLSDNVIGGGIIANGGVSRPDAVHDATTTIQSRSNTYRDDSSVPCLTGHLGWNMNGGSGVPVPLSIGLTERNTLSVHSQDDRLEGFKNGIVAAGGRRFFGAPFSGPVSGNTMELELIGATITTSACGGSDFVLAGAAVSNPSLTPGDNNVLHAVFRGVTGSGARANVFADVLGTLDPSLQGIGNILEFAGSRRSFDMTNSSIDPAPPAAVFAAGK